MAGGRGSDLNPLTMNKPKHLLPILGKPIIVRIIEALKDIGFKEIYIVIYYFGDMIIEKLGDGSKYNVKLNYIDQGNMNGTAVAIEKIEKYVENEEILVVHGDITISKDILEKMIEKYEELKVDAMVLGVKTSPEKLDLVTQPQIIVDKENFLIKTTRKAILDVKPLLINAGVYIFNQKIFDAIKKTPPSIKGKRIITDSLEILSKTGRVYIYVDEGKWWYNLNYPWDLLDSNKYFLEKIRTEIKGVVKPGSRIIGSVIMLEESIVESGATIIGPCFIGKNTTIGANSVIGPNAVIGDNVGIGPLNYISGSLVMDDVLISSHCTVFESIIGDSSYIESGVMIPSISITDKTIKVTINKRRIDTGRKRLGAIISSNVKIGANTSIEPGIMIGPEKIVKPNSRVSKNII